MRRLVIGDIHGRIDALRQVLKKSGFDYTTDKLIVLGDIVDGGYDTYQVVEELLKIDNLVFVLGNHDEFFMNHIRSGWAAEVWLGQGGRNTLESYIHRDQPLISDDDGKLIPVTHQDFFNRAVLYHIEDNMLFVHGGFDPKKGVEKTDRQLLLWDRSLINLARFKSIPRYKKIFVGHTTTQTFAGDAKIKNVRQPLKFNNLIMMDTGAGWTGALSIMNIDTEEFWVSDMQEPAVRDASWY